MTKLLVISDPHITPVGQTIIGLDTHARFTAALDHALAHHPDAAALILLGDLTHHGEPAAYHRLRNAIAVCPVPVVPLVGNHDRRDAFCACFADAAVTPQGHVQTAIDLPGCRLITLDTLDGPPYPAGHHSGWLCDARLAWLDAELAAARNRPVIVCAHHPPFDTGIVGMDAIRLRNGDRLLARLRAHGNAYLLCGHLHRTVSGMASGVPWTIFKSTGHQGPLDLITLDSSLSVDEPPAYGVILLSDTGVTVHSQDLIEGPQILTDPASTSA